MDATGPKYNRKKALLPSCRQFAFVLIVIIFHSRREIATLAKRDYFQLRAALNHARANEDNGQRGGVSRYRNLESRGNVAGCMRTGRLPRHTYGHLPLLRKYSGGEISRSHGGRVIVRRSSDRLDPAEEKAEVQLNSHLNESESVVKARRLFFLLFLSLSLSLCPKYRFRDINRRSSFLNDRFFRSHRCFLERALRNSGAESRISQWHVYAGGDKVFAEDNN